jgi:hypothetical protein
MPDRPINIEKLNPSEFEKEAMPFMMLPTKVVQQISKENPMAAMVWIYLQSLPPTWTPNKFHLMSHFQISERTYQRHMSYLADVNLVSYTRGRNKNGTLGAVRLIVHNGSNFKPALGSDHTAKICIVDFNHTAKKPHCGGTTPVADGDHINNINNIQNKEKEHKEDNPSTDVEDYLISFEKFYSVYPRKKGKQDAIKWFKKNKPNEEFVSKLIEDVKKRIKTEWNGKDLQFVPYPASYLNGKRWEDAIETSEPVKPKYPTPDERAATQQKIIERETKAAEEKRKEIADSKGFKQRMAMSKAERDAAWNAKRIEMGMTVSEYSAYVLREAAKNTNNG